MMMMMCITTLNQPMLNILYRNINSIKKNVLHSKEKMRKLQIYNDLKICRFSFCHIIDRFFLPLITFSCYKINIHICHASIELVL